jgi:hypothetical protein
MNALELINIIAPEHERTSCSDEDLNNGFYSNDNNTRCGRCTLLEILKKGKLPNSHTGLIIFNIDNKKADEENWGDEY